MKKFKVGNQVTWSSQSWGETKTKIGTIVAIVPVGKSAYDFIPEGMSIRSAGFSRKHESYLIKRPNSKVLSWPRVEYLQKSDIPADKCSKSCIEALNKKALYKKALYLMGELFNIITTDAETRTLQSIINDCKNNIYSVKYDREHKED